jgi:hypothetical protein
VSSMLVVKAHTKAKIQPSTVQPSSNVSTKMATRSCAGVLRLRVPA